MSGVSFKLNSIAKLVKSVLINEQIDIYIPEPEQLSISFPPTEQLDVTI